MEKRKETLIVIITIGVLSLCGFLILTGIGKKISENYAYELNYYKNLIKGNNIKETTIKNTNEYTKDYDFEYLRNTKYLYPSNKDELRGVLYAFFNSGETEIEFYCTKKYKNCIKDYKDYVFGDDDLLHYINFYVNPYNEYQKVNSSYDYDLNKITISRKLKYTEEQIEEINKKIDELYDELVNEEDSDYSNIQRIHNYILYHTKYDNVKSDHIDDKNKEDSKYKSDIAYGPLIEGEAICTGYSALMALFLDRMGIENMRIASDKHAWNAVKLNGIWYNLDLTWDDDKNDDIDFDYFLVDTRRMLDEDDDTENHQYYQELFSELNYSR